MKRRYRFFRRMGCDVIAAAFIAVLNEMSNLPPNMAGFMHILWNMDEEAQP